MWPWAAALWLGGGAAAGVLSEVARAESARWALAARLGFAAVLALELLSTAVVFEEQFANKSAAALVSRSGWWVVAVGGMTLTLATGFALLRPAPRRLLHLAATLGGAAAYAAFPLAYTPHDASLGAGVYAVLVAPPALAVIAAMPRRASAATRADARA